MHNRWGKSRGLGFVEFETIESAIAAKEKMHQFKLGDLAIIVDYAKPDPYLTPEGQARHEEALIRHPQRQQSAKAFKKVFKKDTDEKESETPYKHFHSPKDFKHQRQSVFNSRFHHSHVGAKFAKRNKKK